ncbi:DUF6086 family protein [Streptomyces sp. NPDC016845]|uniref:DUF6086 family protein n=1 Tax=Streptomyces sp. NPDC016845 TaxID=3364972 RepID=UPI0037BB0AF0
MSYIFTVDATDEDVWEPSLDIGKLFMGGVEALGKRVLRVPMGLDDVSGDWVKVEPQQYGQFVTLALRRRAETRHWDMVQLMDGVLPLMVALADRIGITVSTRSQVEEAYLAWARDEDRNLLGHVWARHDGTVAVRGQVK